MKIKILESAINDLMDGYWFYKNQLDGLGNYFLDSLFSDIDSLTIYAGIHSKYLNKYHKMLSKRFPFAIYYKVENEIVLIYAVLDCRRNPGFVKDKLT
ncbi:MAG: type II toxin-antitoxin system RelE/ParE family toxin [Candidatus Marinimicrobia bacterium]|nr:type II toxin-antitoxin system RelE/ParE family toxin [Candidatus Neomarinimicrobiota bacterium]